MPDLNPIFTARFNSGDAAALSELYEKDAVFHTPAGPVSGREAIRTMYAAMLADSPTIDSEARRILICGDIALIISEWSFTSGDSGDATSSGISVEVARRQPDGTWLYIIDEPRIPRH
ncbi:nuclear transport factor 2 family protein [Nonomuraea sp. NN258]|uniref:YybH family protein n=1 Tax=Nonomuraea antri TaxID=2730852 RepID=UPI0015693CD6|nr:nuclear transport factor 2 family protein [Nonomuraea antri]NRQ33117.1 nuclear transport factor 2 family protein [Nonomuraea antri]